MFDGVVSMLQQVVDRFWSRAIGVCQGQRRDGRLGVKMKRLFWRIQITLSRRRHRALSTMIITSGITQSTSASDSILIHSNFTPVVEGSIAAVLSATCPVFIPLNVCDKSRLLTISLSAELHRRLDAKGVLNIVSRVPRLLFAIFFGNLHSSDLSFTCSQG